MIRKLLSRSEGHLSHIFGEFVGVLRRCFVLEVVLDLQECSVKVLFLGFFVGEELRGLWVAVSSISIRS
jgi:hypothetical protein